MGRVLCFFFWVRQLRANVLTTMLVLPGWRSKALSFFLQYNMPLAVSKTAAVCAQPSGFREFIFHIYILPDLLFLLFQSVSLSFDSSLYLTSKHGTYYILIL